jgi:diguanylate cyclase (GGDEF)-like protein
LKGFYFFAGLHLNFTELLYCKFIEKKKVIKGAMQMTLDERLYEEERQFVLERERSVYDVEMGHQNLLRDYDALLAKYKNLLMAFNQLVKQNERGEQDEYMKETLLAYQYQHLKLRNRELMEMCAYDTLTEAYTRKFILASIQREVESAKVLSETFAVVMVDIDNFKAINDTYGHFVGDRVLKSFVDLLKKLLRKTDKVGRFGGDEFIIVLPDTNRRVASELLNRLKAGIGELRFPELPGKVRLSASFGYCIYDGQGDWNCESLLCTADQGLLKAKKHGKNSIAYQEMNAKKQLF